MTVTADDICAILHEVAKSRQETERMFQETDRRFKETDRRFKETEQRFKETEQRFKETEQRFQETDRKFQETDRRFKETDQKIRELSGLFTTQWGKLVEALVRPGLLDLFQRRGIIVNETTQRDLVKRDGREMEIDVMLVNGDVVIPVEVKTTLGVQEVREYMQRMKEFLFFFPKYRVYQIFGAVAGVNIQEQADRYAYRQGLFVITLGRDGLCEIINDDKFRPRDLATNEICMTG